jgi:hypothetical protein
LMLCGVGAANAAAKLTTKTCYRPTTGAKVQVTSRKPCSAYGLSSVPVATIPASTVAAAPATIAATTVPPAPGAPAATTAPPAATTVVASDGAALVATFSGSGKLLTPAFQLSNGLVVFEFNHTGRSNFIVHLLNAKGERVDYLFNEIGSVSAGQTYSVVSTGGFVLQVDADGAWSGTATQYRPTGAFPTTGVATGRGQRVVGPIATAGTVVVTATNDGSSNFIVHAVTPEGQREFLFNEIGSFSGQTTFALGRSYVFFAIESNGNWKLDFKPFGK